jgi:hypothetical protein
MAPVHSEAPAAAGASNSAAQPKQLSKLMSGPQRTPMVAAPMSEQVSAAVDIQPALRLPDCCGSDQ